MGIAGSEQHGGGGGSLFLVELQGALAALQADHFGRIAALRTPCAEVCVYVCVACLARGACLDGQPNEISPASEACHPDAMLPESPTSPAVSVPRRRRRSQTSSVPGVALCGWLTSNQKPSKQLTNLRKPVFRDGNTPNIPKASGLKVRPLLSANFREYNKGRLGPPRNGHYPNFPLPNNLFIHFFIDGFDDKPGGPAISRGEDPPGVRDPLRADSAPVGGGQGEGGAGHGHPRDRAQPACEGELSESECLRFLVVVVVMVVVVVVVVVMALLLLLWLLLVAVVVLCYCLWWWQMLVVALLSLAQRFSRVFRAHHSHPQLSHPPYVLQ